ncbi:hypothetical protein GQ54DRAFT_309827 [Martensiomyces pterosporus]|nr:hypothetical protein GQ54DRAFT_309827 [Martensiomyces pterosporus]
MAFFKTLSTIASLATAGSYDINWTDEKTKKAVITHWPEVKVKADDALPLAGLRLTGEQKMLLDELLKGETVFPDEPNDELLDGLPDAIPPASLNRICGAIIHDCLTTHTH